MKKFFVSCMVFIALIHFGFSATYYIDPLNGNDNGEGSQTSPWQSINRTLQARNTSGVRAKAAKAEDVTVILKGGDYGSFELTGTTGQPKAAAAGKWTTYKAAPGETPVFTNISLKYDSPTEVNIRFDGIHILPPAQPAGRAKAAVVPTGAIYLDGAKNVVYENGRCWGPTRQTHDGMVNIQNSINITVQNNEIGNTGYGVRFAQSKDSKILFNQIHSLARSGIKYGPGNSGFLIEGNHIHDQIPWNDSHSSGISLRSGDVIIRGNIIHNGFGSSGMMQYDSDGSIVYHFSNITYENNLLYDIVNAYCLRLYNIVSNIVVRNNTLIGKLRDKNDGRVVLWCSIAGGSAALSVYNNVLVAYASLSGTIANNIMWACLSEGDWVCSLGNNEIKTCSYGTRPFSYFENGFFMEKPNFTPGHGQIIDYRLAPSSPAINFGDASKQPATSLGTLDAKGFIQENGPARDASHHSAGAYEFGTNTRVINAEYPITNAQHPMPALSGVEGSNERLEQCIYDLTGKQAPENTRITGLYLVWEGNGLKKVMVIE